MMAAMMQHSLGNAQQQLKTDRLGDVFYLAAPEKEPVQRAVRRAENNYRNLRQFGVAPDLLERSAPVHTGHIDIQHDQTGQFAHGAQEMQQFEGFHPINSLQQAVICSQAVHRLPEQLQIVLIIVYIKDRMSVWFVFHSGDTKVCQELILFRKGR